MEVKKQNKNTKKQTEHEPWLRNLQLMPLPSLPVVICATNIKENVNVSDKSFIL